VAPIAKGRLRPLQEGLDGPDRHPCPPGHVVRYANRVAATSCEGSSVQARPDDHGPERHGAHPLGSRGWAQSRLDDHRDGHFSPSLVRSRPNPADSWPDSGASNPKQLNLVFQPPAGPVGGYPEGEVAGHRAAMTEDESLGGAAATLPVSLRRRWRAALHNSETFAWADGRRRANARARASGSWRR
jgi:hypothetical protein